MKSAEPVHPRLADRRRDVGFEAIMAETKAWKERGRPVTAKDRLEQIRLRAPIFRAAALGQLTEAEFHKLHGYVSALHGFETGGRLVPMESWSIRRTLAEAARVAA